ncbi:G-D-S-L family lipolytic protein [Nonlabens sp. YIK11]|uniref:SGNH/GDSL hydrolase family protein n=1 Tax=Nonlabens sp. YIK11 TaxID=1453349 RepID=UPI0006DCE751|nr:SGNH/GDSL hydrolase family protein [Nonlabens sp. YIK11]KQC34488.1 G-D-S-L family lipolytic protein [Nonlabens sp. YIK11]
MKNSIKYIALFAAAAVLVSCENEFDESIEDGGVYTAGEADFTKFVSVGNSLTSGFADNALYLEGQQNSFPNIMAQQFELVGGGEFNQPLVNDNIGGLLFNGAQLPGFNTRLVLTANAMGPVGPSNIAGTPTTDISNVFDGPLNNFGVPGAKSFHLGASGYGNPQALPNANPFYIRFASTPNATVIGDAAAAGGTFFTLWIGNNDILSYATSGGSGVDQNAANNIDPTTYGPNDITDDNVFASVYSGYVQALTANGAKGALINIPDVTSIPFFTTVPSQALSPLDPDFGPQIPLLNQLYGGLNSIFTAFGQPNRRIQFSTTAASGLVVRDNDLTDLSNNPAFVDALVPLIQGVAAAVQPPLPLTQAQAQGLAQILAPQFGQIRQATANDLITFPAASLLGGNNQAIFSTLTGAGLPAELAGALTANGVTFPLADNFNLDEDEQASVAAAQASYNATIAALAQANGLALVDARAALQSVAQGGIAFNGGTLTSTYASGGAFSLDAVHPTPRGYAFTANTVINAINATYGSTIPTVDIGQYKSVQPSNSVAQ